MLFTNDILKISVLAVSSDNMTIINYEVSTRTGDKKEMTIIKENYASLAG